MTTLTARQATELRDLDGSLPIALLRSRELAMARFRPMLREHQLTEQQWRVIRVLADAGPLEVSELAEACSLIASSLSRILRDLVDRGLVTREAVAEDSRRFSVQLTAAGVEVFQEVAPESEAIYLQIESAFGRERLNKLLRSLRELNEALKL